MAAGRRWLLLLVLALVVGLSTPWPAAARTLSTQNFLASPAAQAYRERRYADALAALDQMRARFPDDVTVMRVRGMTLYNLGRYLEAGRALEKVVSVDPQNAAARFWLAATLFKTGDKARAYSGFRQTVALAPASPYALQAQKFIEFLDKQAMERGRRSVKLAAGTQYDDNVSLTNNGRIGSFRIFEKIDGHYPLLSKPGWLVAVEGSGNFSQNTGNQRDVFGNKASDFDLVSGKGAINIRHETSIFGIPVAPGFKYAFDAVAEGYHRYSDIHALTASFEANPAPDKIIRIYYRFNLDYFANEGVNPALTSRDGKRHAVGIENFLFFEKNRHYVWGAYEYLVTNANGLNFDARAHLVSGGFSLSLWDNWILKGSAAYALTRYVNYVVAPKRRSAKQTYKGELSRKIGDNVVVSLGYAYAFDDSNYSILETHQNVVTLTVKHKL